MNQLRSRIEEVQERIARAARVSGRGSKDVTLLAVTKTWPASAVREAFACGLRSFGENYAQEALAKKSELRDLAIDWHFIGHLQTNKVKSVIGEFSLIHSVDRLKLAREISRRAMAAGASSPQGILVEVNVASEAGKSGVSWDELPRLLDEVQELPSVQIRGLMVMPPPALPSEESRRIFAQVRDERDRLAPRLSAPHSLIELSMGTSHDYVEAVEAGATIVRLGTVIFGQRGE